MRAPLPVYPSRADAIRAAFNDPLAFGVIMGYRGDEDGRKQFGPVHRLIADRLLGSPRTSTLIPRNHGKSTLISAVFPAWMLLRDPSLRIMMCSASKDLARELIGEVRDIFWGDMNFQVGDEEVWIPLRSIFPHITPRGRRDSEGATDYIDIRGKKAVRGPTGRERSIFASSPTTRSTGKHPNMIIVDDPCDLQNSITFDQRQKIIKWFKALNPILKSRSAPLHHIGTVWAPGDLSQNLSENAAFHQLRLRAWVPENPETGVADGLGPGPLPGGRWAEKYAGCYPLDPSYMTAEELWEEERDAEESGLGHFFAAQYLNEWMVAADAVFGDDVILKSTFFDVPAFADYPLLLLWDPTGRLTGTAGDANGLVLVQPVPLQVFRSFVPDHAPDLEPDRNVFIVRGAWQIRGGISDGQMAVEELCRDDPTIKAIWVEEAINQAAVAPWLAERKKIEGVSIRGQKISADPQARRLQGLATAMREGQFVLPHEFPGRDLMIRQFTEYPKSDFDDIPTAAALLGQHRERRGSLPGLPPPSISRDPTQVWPEQFRAPTRRPPARDWP